MVSFIESQTKYRLIRLDNIDEIFIDHNKIVIRKKRAQILKNSITEYYDEPITKTMTDKQVKEEWQKILNFDPKYFVNCEKNKSLEKSEISEESEESEESEKKSQIKTKKPRVSRPRKKKLKKTTIHYFNYK